MEGTSIGACPMGTGLTYHTETTAGPDNGCRLPPQGGDVVLPPRPVSHARRGASRSAPRLRLCTPCTPGA